MNHVNLRLGKLLPHLFFLILIAVIFLIPNRVENESSIPLLILLIPIEAIVLLRRKKQSSRDIGTLLYFFFIVWELGTSKLPTHSNYLIPSPEKVLHIYLTDYPLILKGIGTSAGMLAVGFFWSILLGTVLGIIVGWYVRAREVLLPIVKVVTPIPPLIYTPYFITLMPTFWYASVAIIFCSVFWGLFLCTIYTVAGIDQKLLDSVKVLNLKPFTLFKSILLPYCLPHILARLNGAVSAAFMVLITAEMIGGSSGVGWYVKYFTNYGDYSKSVSGIFVVAVLVTLLNLLIKKLTKYLVVWEDNP